MTLTSAALTLFLVMDPLGNIPFFISALRTVEEKKRTWIILRESLIAFGVLVFFLLIGNQLLADLHITKAALQISGGIILFLIALKMIFPAKEKQDHDYIAAEPFIVPLAIPLLAGPSALATVLVFSAQSPEKNWLWFAAIAIAAAASLIVLLFAIKLQKLLGKKLLTAMEHLMGMLLTTIAIQMLLSGVQDYFMQ